jgi:sulfur carrier protein ThiS
MIRLSLSSPLFALVPPEERPANGRGRAVELEATSWPEVVEEVHRRFPDVARHVLTGDGGIVPGFVLVVNDEVMPRGKTEFPVADGDELTLLAALAGG